jgi:hypothetical protein
MDIPIMPRKSKVIISILRIQTLPNRRYQVPQKTGSVGIHEIQKKHDIYSEDGALVPPNVM